jgi:hypothetical protein
MGLINWIFDLYQHSRIEDLHQRAAQARSEALALRTSGGGVDVARLERAIGELALAVKTLKRLAIEKGLCTPAELDRLLHTIDLEDGTADGIAPIR